MRKHGKETSNVKNTAGRSIRAKDQEFDYKKNFEAKRYNDVLPDTISATRCLRTRQCVVQGSHRIMLPVLVAPVWVSDTDI